MGLNEINEIAEKLDDLVRKSGVSVASWAADLGFSRQYLSDVRTGRRKPSARFMKRLVDCLRCSGQDAQEWHRLAAKAHGWRID